jgi:hypothetical protein
VFYHHFHPLFISILLTSDVSDIWKLEYCSIMRNEVCKN